MSETTTARAPARDRTHYLYLAVIAAVVIGIIVGFAAPGFAVQLKPLGTGFVNLVKMMISPIIFCTIVLGIGSVRQAAKVGKVGGLALGYFLVMSTAALAIGLVVGNLIHPGEGLQLTQALKTAGAKAAGGPAATGAVDFLLNVIPTTLFSALTQSQVLQTLLVALLVGFALQSMGRTGEPVLRGIGHLQRLVFLVIASKGAAGVTGAGLATLAGGLQSHRPELVDGVGLIVGIDRFMSEARALTNFAGNAVATVIVGTWAGEFDRVRARQVLTGQYPFDERTMLDDDAHAPAQPVSARPAAGG